MYSRPRSGFVRILPLASFSLLVGCGASGDGKATIDVEDGVGRAMGNGTPPSATSGGGLGAGNGPSFVGISEGGPSATSQAVADPCVTVGCGPGQRCVLQDATASCVDNSCDDLRCSEIEECRPAERGGNICVNVFCSQDVDCEPGDYCSAGGVCLLDVCVGGQSTCDGDAVRVCASNGGAEEVPYTCGSTSYFATSCIDPLGGSANCSCEDDWDCPAFTVCEVDECVGTGFASTCTLPPGDFDSTEPAVELHWGGDSSANDLAHDGSGTGAPAPWANSSHVQATPIVANLDDDNGDGLINELDFPEILFITYTAGQVDNSGILRAVHGGGPDRGKDFFAVCGNLVWQEGDPLPAAPCSGDGRSRSPAAVGDLDGDGTPEVIQVTANNGFRVLDSSGNILISQQNQGLIQSGGISLTPAIANLDFAGLPELVFGTTVLTLGQNAAGDLFISNRYTPPAGSVGQNDIGGPMSCIADLTDDNGQEILAGPTLYRLPDNIPACGNPPCQGTLERLWTAPNNLLANDGLCAVADLWGANANAPPGPNNPPDGSPEAVFIANGNLIILDGQTGALIEQRNLDTAANGAQRRGGAPNVDDFDGDGFLEVASALESFYVVVDLQDPTVATGSCPAWPVSLPRVPANNEQALNPARNPGGACSTDNECNAGSVCNEQAGRCVCLHNGWQRTSDDESSRLTSSSVFDFNGDGAAEVVYNDECEFRIFDGVSGEVAFNAVSRGRTWTENPVVADVDNDGNAEVVTFSNTENLGQVRCNDDGNAAPAGPNGIRVFGDAQDTWVSARRIWNQQSYHVTNVTESAGIPVHPPESWLSFNDHDYNTYRSQPRSFGVAPDLTISAVGLFSSDAQCGVLSNQVNISFEVENRGDLRVGPGVQVSFFGSWNGIEVALTNAQGAPLTATLAVGIDARRSVIALAPYDIADQAGQDTLPDVVRVIADTGGAQGSNFGAERECDESNNSLEKIVEPGEQLPDLSVAAGEARPLCASSTVELDVIVQNTGVAPAVGVVIQVFAGNPTQGGTLMAEQILAEAVPPGGEVPTTIAVTGFPRSRSITLWAAVDPNNAIAECNEGDNTDPADNPALCPGLR